MTIDIPLSPALAGISIGSAELNSTQVSIKSAMYTNNVDHVYNIYHDRA